MDVTRLTLYSHGAGCGCKMAPDLLEKIIHSDHLTPHFPNLLVGNEYRDDAAVMDLGDGNALISTTDFFMPIVDDPFDFGRIAATNALSDIYAMGGKPILALAILGWPVKQLEPSLAGRVMEGAREVCHHAGIPIAGGHSIDSVEPFFGLAVNGLVPIEHIIKNQGASPGDLIYLTKPIGTGILTTAMKLERLKEEDREEASRTMLLVNSLGMHLGKVSFVHAMTDVTGFGLLGHLIEMCKASGVGASLEWERIPTLSVHGLDWYIRMQCVPAATEKNWNAVIEYTEDLPLDKRAILCDPQTSGGLLIAVAPEAKEAFESLVAQHQAWPIHLIGKFTDRTGKVIIDYPK